jgi:hypothetical protein
MGHPHLKMSTRNTPGHPPNPTSYSPNGNEINLFGLNSGGVTNVLNDEIMGTTLTDSSLSFYVLGQGSGTNRNRFSSSPNAANILQSPTLTGNPTAPTQALTDTSTKVATTQFTKGLFGTWDAFIPTNFNSTSTVVGQWTTPSTDGITLTTFDMVLGQAPNCGTPGALSIVDHSSSDTVLMTINTTSGTTTYTTTGSVNVSAGHVLRFKVSTVDTCGTHAMNPTATATYQFQ